MVYFGFVCLLKLILYNSIPHNQMCDLNIKYFCFVLQKSEIKLSRWLTHLTLRFLYLVALAHGAPRRLALLLDCLLLRGCTGL